MLGKEEEGSEESSEEESSEYSEETDSEEEGPRLKPVFVRKKDRITIHQKEQQQFKLKQVCLMLFTLSCFQCLGFALLDDHGRKREV